MAERSMRGACVPARALIGRALGYPSASVGELNCDIAYVRCAGPEEGSAATFAHLTEVDDAAMLLDFMAAAPDEIPAVLEHFLACRKACAGLLELGLAMGGRFICSAALEALEGKADEEVVMAFDAWADKINGLNSEEERDCATLV